MHNLFLAQIQQGELKFQYLLDKMKTFYEIVEDTLKEVNEIDIYQLKKPKVSTDEFNYLKIKKTL